MDLFMSCVTSARYHLSHADRVLGNIIPERGLAKMTRYFCIFFSYAQRDLHLLFVTIKLGSLLKASPWLVRLHLFLTCSIRTIATSSVKLTQCQLIMLQRC